MWGVLVGGLVLGVGGLVVVVCCGLVVGVLAALMRLGHQRLLVGQQVLDLGPVLDGGSQAPVGGGAVRRPQITARRSGWLIEAIKMVYTRLGLGEAVSDDWAFEQMVVACLIAATSKAEPLRVLSEIG